PESTRTTGGGASIVANFWKLASLWWAVQDRRPADADADFHSASFSHILPPPLLPPPLLPSPSPPSPLLPSPLLPSPSKATSSNLDVNTIILNIPSFSTPAICEAFGVADEERPFVLLDSAAQGRFTIIGCSDSQSIRITYFVKDRFVSVHRGGITSQIPLEGSDVWTWLSRFMSSRRASGNPDIPFWGGLVGYLSYELGVDALDVPLRRSNPPQHADVNLLFVERSIVVDTLQGKTYVQSLVQGDPWLSSASTLIHETYKHHLSSKSSARSRLDLKIIHDTPTLLLPAKESYISRIKEAQEHLSAGNSYEICLTTRSKLSFLEPGPSSALTKPISSWNRYNRLRTTNPAPHAAFMRLHPTTIISSSPERFLSYSRGSNPLYQMRPIKGTVKKGGGVNRAVAEARLVGCVKEVAENLMIVDLIRHDLHGAVGSDVQVKKFCVVEEYETVFQLVSVIEARASLETANEALDFGWGVLRKCLPPGSMTGAPKKRSVEILQSLETDERGVYSGVHGYWCVGGGGDWAVTIRTCFKYDAEVPSRDNQSSRCEDWVLGAGGAITALSDPEAEWDEMVTKLQSVLGAFSA
ncbi:Putative aminodeoxychorismate synthase, partial [Leucoagaricus sp. SymC.cos]